MAHNAIEVAGMEHEEQARAAARRRKLLDMSSSLVGLIVLLVIGAALAPGFTTPTNVVNVLRQVSVNALLAAGLTFVIISGGIDLSVGSSLAFVGVVAVILMSPDNFGWNPLVASVAAIAVSTFGGLISGFWVIGWGGPRVSRTIRRLPLPGWLRAVVATFVEKGAIPPFIVTLGMMLILRGLAIGICGEQPVMAPASFRWLGQGEIGGIPTQIYITFAVYLICWWVLARWKFGRAIYAIGDNEEVARLSGINTNWVKLRVYAFSGFMAGLAAVVLASRLASGYYNIGEGDELTAIAAVIIGGTSLAGGEGGIWGTLIGALIIAIVMNLINLLGVPAWGQYAARGLVIMFAVYMDVTLRARTVR